MTIKNNKYRFLFAGGGTGGHLYPAIAVAQQIIKMIPEAEVLFVGTSDKIESRVVPKLGYKFKTIWISGFYRKLNVKNLLFPVKLIVSMLQSLWINIKFKPRVAIGSGAYVSGPAIWGASVMGAKILLLEQNSYPGISNRLLERKAEEIHITFKESEKYFREKGKLKLSGNPIRIDLQLVDKYEALKKFNLAQNKKTLLVLGGSLGARSLNKEFSKIVKRLVDENIQIIWQAGELYYDEYQNFNSGNVKVVPFIEDMSAAYSACDLLIARAGATTIAEVSLLGLPVIFVPSPNVAANHQFMNAEALKKANAAELIDDKNMSRDLFNSALSLINDDGKLNELKNNIKEFSNPEAAKLIAESAVKLAEKIY